MESPHLDIVYRNGKPASAYLVLPRIRGDKAVRTVPSGCVLVDYAADGRPIGLEIESIDSTTLPAVRRVLNELGVKGVDANDLAALGPP